MIRVLIVDDSAFVRKYLSEELGKEHDIEVVGSAMDPYIARQKIVELKPDVITLDLEMPRMDGLSFLEKLMQHYPIPVVVVSSLTPQNSENALMAMQLGAIEVICKPGSAYSTEDISGQIVEAVRVASKARLRKKSLNASNSRANRNNRVSNVRLAKTTNKIIAIGSSTGGTRALETVLTALPATVPGIVIVQHMPPVFTKKFADRLNGICQVEVKEAEQNDYIEQGKVLIAPGNYHMLIKKRSAKYFVSIKDGPHVQHNRPSVDVLFKSVAKEAGSNAMGVILTGMGSDGARGMKSMRDEGCYTIGQDEDTCVVYGMPKVAYEMGGVVDVRPLQDIADGIIDHFK